MDQRNGSTELRIRFCGRSGPYLIEARQACVLSMQPKTAEDMRVNVTDCAIVAIAPDPSSLVYDNIWWLVLFAITSGGLPGMESASPPHHVEAHSEREGLTMCEAWLFDPCKPKAISKGKTMDPLGRGIGFISIEWAIFFLSVTLWLYFCAHFGRTLKPALDVTFDSVWAAGAMWYYMSASPAVIGLVFELMRNRVDLYDLLKDPRENSKGLRERAKRDKSCRCEDKNASTMSMSDQSPASGCGSHGISGDDRSIVSSFEIISLIDMEWVFVLGRAVAGGIRIVIFIVGPITMGNIILMPVPDDLYLFILLLFTTGVPRQFWSAFWTNGNRGADLVVWFKTVKIMRPGVTD